MDRRSWLWRRKSSEKSPSGETESSGSVSSHSERFSDDQTLLNDNIQSPEVASKAAPEDELDDSMKTLSEKFSEAILNIDAKEDLIKQHAKVAEEAVSGWEKAENEVSVLKKQNDALTQKNTILEERVGHLDGALKECLRQLRQAREDQEEKIHVAMAERRSEWASQRSELESQLVELHNTLAGARAKLEAAEKENSILKLELERRIRERDLCAYTAETSSKQLLDGIKKVARLEAECRRLKALVRKAAATDDHQSVATSSIYVESFTDSQSDNDNEPFYPDSRGFASRKDRKSLIVPSVEIDLMDDFLEMERIVALPEMENGSRRDSRIDGEESLLRNESDSLKKITAEKVRLEVALHECGNKLMASEDQLKQTEAALVDLKEKLVRTDEEVECSNLKLMNLTKLLDEAEGRLGRAEDKLSGISKLKSALELQLEDANVKSAESESRLKVTELELKTLRSSIGILEKEVEKERIRSREAEAKRDELEAEISGSKSNSRLQRSAFIEEFRINQDKEMAAAASKFSECQKTIASLGRQLKSLAALEDFLNDCEIPDVLKTEPEIESTRTSVRGFSG